MNNIYNKNLIDRFNPFDNNTENRDYNTDYRKILPLISLDGFQFPVNPSKKEKRKIRHYYNAAGLMTVVHFFATIIISFVLIYIFSIMLSFNDTFKHDVLPSNYDDIFEEYIYSSSIMMGAQLLTFLIVNLLVFFIFCKAYKIKISSFFQSTDVNAKNILRYMAIGIFLQTVAMIIIIIAQLIFSALGIELYSPDFDMGNSTKLMIVTIIYTCIVAPITEELMYRGFFLRNMSAVSQRVGIFTSALMFAAFHQNLIQAILAFILGIFLARITIKHNSIIPAIAVHMAVNSFSMINQIIYMVAEENTADIVTLLLTLIITIIGFILFIYTRKKLKDKLPKSTKLQKKRGYSLAFSSPLFILGIFFNVIMIFINQL